MSDETLVRVTGPYFCAGFVLNKYMCLCECAPILAKFFKYNGVYDVFDIFSKRRWKVEIVYGKVCENCVM